MSEERDVEEVNLSGRGIGPGAELRGLLTKLGLAVNTVPCVLQASPDDASRILAPGALRELTLAYALESERAFGVPRSPHWRKVSDEFLRQNPHCAVTGTVEGVVAHHIIPVHVNPNKELEEDNLIPLAPFPHLLFGHLMNWWSYNESVRENARYWKEKVQVRPMPSVNPGEQS